MGGLLATGSRFVACWVGPEYGRLGTCTLFIIIPSVFDVPLLVENTAIVAAGYVKQRGVIYITMAMMNIVLGFLLASRFGAAGACAAICLSYFVRTAGQCVL